jgi:WXXGXW repeat (2 copies)
MKKKLIAGFLLAGSCLFAAPRIAVGVGIGVPVAPYGYVAPPPIPGPGYTWTAGYWYGVGPRRVWRPGYWVAPRAHYFAPRARFRR